MGLHLGTFVAVVVYFWQDWCRIIGAAWRGLRQFSRVEEGHARFVLLPATEDGHARLAWFLLLGTIPGAIAGVLFENQAEAAFRDIRLVAIMLMVLGLLLFLAERLARHIRDMEHLSFRDSALIGLAQAFAVIPGVSRSGSTISMGLFRGLQRDTAARFSFLLGTPIILGASIKRLPSIFEGGMPADERQALLIGAIAAAVASFATIAVLLRFLQRHSTMPFVIYRLALGLGLLVLAAWRG